MINRLEPIPRSLHVQRKKEARRDLVLLGIAGVLLVIWGISLL